jgi:hypothetical protein
MLSLLRTATMHFFGLGAILYYIPVFSQHLVDGVQTWVKLGDHHRGSGALLALFDLV